MRGMALAATLGAVVMVAATSADLASAHTEADLAGVPAGTESTITLQPTHGCAGSPTVQVRIRAPMEGAVAEPVDGWTATSSADGAGNTVLKWTNGLLPADTAGAFPASFVAPDAPGRLLIFPAIQVCESGEELAWISGDPQSEFPAPRVLVLPVGYEPAETIDDVPLDAPGRDQLVQIVDVDNPQAPPTTATPPPTTVSPTTAPPPTTVSPTTVATTAPSTEPPRTTGSPGTTPATTTGSTAGSTTTTVGGDSGGSSNTPIMVAGVVGVLAAGGAGAFAVSRRRPSA